MLTKPFGPRVKLSSDESDLPSGSARRNDRARAVLRSEILLKLFPILALILVRVMGR